MVLQRSYHGYFGQAALWLCRFFGQILFLIRFPYGTFRCSNTARPILTGTIRGMLVHGTELMRQRNHGRI